LTGVAGLVVVAELDGKLAITKALDGRVGAFKQRGRGLSAGELLVAMASCQLAGGNHLVSLDRQRADAAGQRLAAVAAPASTTAAGLARRFRLEQFAGIETAIGEVNERVLGLVGQVRRSALKNRFRAVGDRCLEGVRSPGPHVRYLGTMARGGGDGHDPRGETPGALEDRPGN
jgi:hypothetical protein